MCEGGSRCCYQWHYLIKDSVDLSVRSSGCRLSGAHGFCLEVGSERWTDSLTWINEGYLYMLSIRNSCQTRWLPGVCVPKSYHSFCAFKDVELGNTRSAILSNLDGADLSETSAILSDSVIRLY